MNLDALAPLTDRWPDDSISAPAADVQALSRLFSTDKLTNIYDDQLRLDVTAGRHIADFAAANGWAYAARTSVSAEHLQDSARAWPGHIVSTTAPMLAHAVQGRVGNFDVRMYLAYTIAAAQKDGDTAVRLDRRSVINVTLPKLFPQMVLESHKNDKSYVSTMPSTFMPDQIVSLEGDFDAYFDLYAPKGLQANTLAVLAPNFMQQLMQSSALFDVEFFGTDMVLITKDPLYTPQVMQQALAALDVQLQYMDRLLASWNYTPRQQPFDTLQKPFLKGEMIKVGRLRISPSRLITLVIAMFILYGCLIAFLN